MLLLRVGVSLRGRGPDGFYVGATAGVAAVVRGDRDAFGDDVVGVHDDVVGQRHALRR